ncbi:MAG: insulinase family protein [Planctomycetes bacterium]|nr:insulinase family protein [Planctomycetota bacterium]
MTLAPIGGVRMNVVVALSVVVLALSACASLSVSMAGQKDTGSGPKLVTVDSPSPLVEIRVAFRTGSADDPPGKEGLASLTARMILEGGFGDPKKPVTKEKLAEITQPWGGGASPSARVDKDLTTFSMTVPEEVLGEFTTKVLGPMMTQPLFNEDELRRLIKERAEDIGSSLRFESTENLGLVVMDTVLHVATSYGHPPIGTVKGIQSITRDDVRAFCESRYVPAASIVGISSAKSSVTSQVQAALSGVGSSRVAASAASSATRPRERGRMPHGREVLVVTTPSAIASGVHAGFPLDVKRGDADYWPLYVGNVALGTHRDGFGYLYKRIREQRGYNYGDYSYLEWFPDRFALMFPPPNAPRRFQDFTVWLRPVQHAYVVHLMKAIGSELDRFIADGLTDEEVALAKNKARVLYLNLAETNARLLGYRIDDVVYGMEGHGFLDEYLRSIDAVTPAQVNAAIKKHLQTANLEFVVVTDEKAAPAIVDAIKRDGVEFGKDAKAYAFEQVEENGQKLYKVSDAQLDILRRDGMWASWPLLVKPDDVHVVKAADLFETAFFPTMKP